MAIIHIHALQGILKRAVGLAHDPAKPHGAEKDAIVRPTSKTLEHGVLAVDQGRKLRACVVVDLLCMLRRIEASTLNWRATNWTRKGTICRAFHLESL
jgi:hypothetical protein